MSLHTVPSMPTISDAFGRYQTVSVDLDPDNVRISSGDDVKTYRKAWKIALQAIVAHIRNVKAIRTEGAHSIRERAQAEYTLRKLREIAADMYDVRRNFEVRLLTHEPHRAALLGAPTGNVLEGDLRVV